MEGSLQMIMQPKFGRAGPRVIEMGAFNQSCNSRLRRAVHTRQLKVFHHAHER